MLGGVHIHYGQTLGTHKWLWGARFNSRQPIVGTPEDGHLDKSHAIFTPDFRSLDPLLCR